MTSFAPQTPSDTLYLTVFEGQSSGKSTITVSYKILIYAKIRGTFELSNCQPFN